jgi:hypothetical protein
MGQSSLRKLSNYFCRKGSAQDGRRERREEIYSSIIKQQIDDAAKETRHNHYHYNLIYLFLGSV